MNEKKYKSVVAIWGAILLILQALALINVVGLNPSEYEQLTKLITALVAVVMIGLVIAFLVLTLKKKKAGPIIGIVIGALYIAGLSIINIIVGVCFIISCVGMMKQIEKVESK